MDPEDGLASSVNLAWKIRVWKAGLWWKNIFQCAPHVSWGPLERSCPFKGKWHRCPEKKVTEKVCCSVVYIQRGTAILANTHPPPQTTTTTTVSLALKSFRRPFWSLMYSCFTFLDGKFLLIFFPKLIPSLWRRSAPHAEPIKFVADKTQVIN